MNKQKREKFTSCIKTSKCVIRKKRMNKIKRYHTMKYNSGWWVKDAKVP